MEVILRGAYERRVDEALAYLFDVGAEAAAQRLLDEAYDVLPDLLARLPRIGRDFLHRNPETPEISAVWEKTRELLCGKSSAANGES